MAFYQSLTKALLPAAAIFAFSSIGQGQTAADQAKALPAAPFSATAAQLQAASAAAPPTREDEAQILLEEGIYRIAADGSLFYQHRLIFRVDNKQSLNDWAEISMKWDPWFEKPAELHARVLRADGQFVEMDQKTITRLSMRCLPIRWRRRG